MSLGRITVKLLSIFSKLSKFAKVFKVVKLALFSATVASYSIFMGPLLAFVMLAMLAIHEHGHVWAMRRLLGMKVRGIYYIPFLGIGAVPGEDFKTRWREGVAAIFGPVFGLIPTFAAFALGGYFNNHFLVGVGILLALVHLFNLLPLYPLDGGRMVYSALSVFTQSRILLVGVLLLLGGLLFYRGVWILGIVIVTGMFEILKRDRERAQFRQSGWITLAYFGLTALFLVPLYLHGSMDLFMNLWRDTR